MENGEKVPVLATAAGASGRLAGMFGDGFGGRKASELARSPVAGPSGVEIGPKVTVPAIAANASVGFPGHTGN